MLFYSGGYFALFKIRQWSIQIEMDGSQHFPETLVVPYKYYIDHLERDGKEIIWNGKYYDIKVRTFKDGLVILKAKYDQQESSLISQLSHFLKEKDHKGNNAGKAFSKVLKMDFFLFFNFHFISSNVSDYVYDTFSELAIKGYSNPIYSPPKMNQVLFHS